MKVDGRGERRAWRRVSSVDVVSLVVFVVARGVRDGGGWSVVNSWCGRFGRFKFFDTGEDIGKEEVGG